MEQFNYAAIASKKGMLDQFIAEWKEGVAPLQKEFGFALPGAWSLPESGEFVWVIGYEGDFDDADRVYYESDDRKRQMPIPAVHIDEVRHSIAEIVLQAAHRSIYVRLETGGQEADRTAGR